jgi:hypothetical protein
VRRRRRRRRDGVEKFVNLGDGEKGFGYGVGDMRRKRSVHQGSYCRCRGTTDLRVVVVVRLQQQQE